MPEPSSRGVLRPQRLPEFHRIPAVGAAAGAVRWFWISRWDLADGESSTQDVIGFPAMNLVVEGDAAVISGATTRLSARVLTGAGWAVGALLRPTAVGWLGVSPAAVVDRVEPVELPDLVAAVGAAMPDPAAAAGVFGEFVAAGVGTPSDDAVLADRIATVIEGDSEIVSVDDVAGSVGTSARTVQRLTLRFTGLTPVALIRRRRLQEAAELVRDSPRASLADIAAATGFSDHAHLTREFTRVLGFTPSAYRGN
ncbi:hypothetical protein nbrc107696_38210 [Gordonia spumicola]|uniref:HTH araC/xylS-type domain-containing protein n=1 Tax=Gordonia spumicola TaxID=589161 RepID=A0A7I9VDE4_9ACTN|nr:helix-turn-helix transcriptional regulator [Gordonia spumicola]GEE03375.1 hypothetical protein nbrc107696_38210 [Gordonia spumicola]